MQSLVAVHVGVILDAGVCLVGRVSRRPVDDVLLNLLIPHGEHTVDRCDEQRRQCGCLVVSRDVVDFDEDIHVILLSISEHERGQKQADESNYANNQSINLPPKECR